MATSLLTSSKTAHRNLIRTLTQAFKRSTAQHHHEKHIYRTVTGTHNARVLTALSRFQIQNTGSFRRNAFAQVRYFRTTSVVCDDIREVATPAFADSISEGDVAFQRELGDVVAEDDVVCEIETEKTAIPVMAPTAGEIIEMCVEDGATVTPGTILFKLKAGAAGGGAKPAAPKEEAAAPTPAAAPVHAVPKPAAAAGEIPTHPPPVPPLPTGPMSSKPAASVPVTPAAASTAAPVAAGSRDVKRVKMNPMRRRIAQRLKDAQNECAMLTTFNEIDMSNIMELRSSYKDAFTKKHGLKLGFMSAFVRASAYALTDMPVVNAVIDEAEIVYRDYVDISVAVATPKGLVVPVLRDVEGMNYVDIERELNNLAEKARSGSLAIEDMDGGTFTISNGGVYGSMFGTPIINPPQSAILGMHGIFDRPVAVKGKVEIRPMMYVALTYDHRLIDGREAVTFLKKIKSAVEDPRVMLLDL